MFAEGVDDVFDIDFLILHIRNMYLYLFSPVTYPLSTHRTLTCNGSKAGVRTSPDYM